MLQQHYNFQEVIKSLVAGSVIDLNFDYSNIQARFVEDTSKLSLTTSVYVGSNYIPSGVRTSLSHKFSFSHPVIKTFLTINEQEFKIQLNYLGDAEDLNHSEFNEIVEEFGDIAENWRIFLDEKDRNDLVYVKARR